MDWDFLLLPTASEYFLKKVWAKISHGRPRMSLQCRAVDQYEVIGGHV